MDERIHRIEQTLADENTRHRQRLLRTAGSPPTFSGALHESAADFCTDLQRFMNNSGIHDHDLVNYVPDYLTGSAREFFRTLTPDHTTTQVSAIPVSTGCACPTSLPSTQQVHEGQLAIAT